MKEAAKLLALEEDLLHAELNKRFLQAEREERLRQEREQRQAGGAPSAAPLRELRSDTEAAAFETFLPVAPEQISPARVLEVQEQEMLRLLVNYGFEAVSEDLNVCDYLLREVADVQFKVPLHQRVLEAYTGALAQGVLPQLSYFIASPDVEVRDLVISLVSEKHNLSELWRSRHQIFTKHEADDLAKTVYESVLRLKKKVLIQVLAEAREKIREAEGPGQDPEN
ncbi:hypothetical protein [Nitritalea halalkaliphila]|uniref:hypothetical protein n=1 Tax=Nitritalea halalkaliphila TaxID=590849 RepID=UPI0002EFEAED|nr:hypothetical protein [Nitritalea halalkaliphila]